MKDGTAGPDFSSQQPTRAMKSMSKSDSGFRSQEKKNLLDLYGSHYVKRFENEQSPLRLKRLIPLMELSGDMTVCDIGCGNGMLMEHICPLVARYVGVDFSEEFIVAANRRKEVMGIKNAEFQCEEIKTFCRQRPTSFDVAFAMDLAEHVYDKEWVEILSAIRSSLKPRGNLYLHTPNADFIVEKLKAKNIVLKQFPEHIAVRDEEQNRAMLKLAGYDETKTTKLPHYNILRILHPVSGIPLLGRYFEARLFIKASVSTAAK